MPRNTTARKRIECAQSTIDPTTEKSKIARQIEIIKKLREHERYNRIQYYDPYPYQKRFHNTGSNCNQRLLMAGNRIGKSFSGACETAMHLTGLYPEWWQGRRYKKPITAWCGGVSNETVRDILQAELLGTPGDPQASGTGAIPRTNIIKAERKPGVPNANSVVQVKHISGGTSYLYFKAYEMGPEKWYGRSVDFVWLDELPPSAIYSQAVTRTLDREGMVCMTYTPEAGFDRITAQFLNNLMPGQSLTNAGWNDADENIRTVINANPGHLTEAAMTQILATYSPHEREMRKNGRPSIGSGLVFPIPEEKLMVDPYPIPSDWPRILGIDFGYDHPTALTCIAVNPETIGTDEEDIVVYDTYRQSKAPPHVHSIAIKTRGNYPIAWPHDGNRRDSMGNPGLADQYRSHGLNMLLEHFTNPPALGEKKGGNSIETGIMHMLTMMETGRFKVFSTLTDWWEEFRMYHRKDNRVVPLHDDLMASCRYGVMSTRFAVAEDDPTWTNDVKYQNYGIV